VVKAKNEGEVCSLSFFNRLNVDLMETSSACPQTPVVQASQQARGKKHERCHFHMVGLEPIKSRHQIVREERSTKANRVKGFLSQSVTVDLIKRR
jgi:hypothetical protein